MAVYNNGTTCAITRQHITRPSLWTRESGTDYWVNFGATAWPGIAADELLTDYGWTLTAITSTVGSGADLLSSTDVGAPTIAALETANDLLQSPTVFGDYGAGLIAAQFLGYIPTQLCMEVYANFSINSGAETTSGFGFSTGSSLTVTNHTAFIHSDGTNFAIRSTPGTTIYIDTGTVVDTSYHRWKIVMTAGSTAEWFIDGTSQGTITLVTDLYPTAFSASVATNDINIDWVHVWYQ